MEVSKSRSSSGKHSSSRPTSSVKSDLDLIKGEELVEETNLAREEVKGEEDEADVDETFSVSDTGTSISSALGTADDVGRIGNTSSISLVSGKSHSSKKKRELTEQEKIFYELYNLCKLGDATKLIEFINKVERDQEEKGFNNNTPNINALIDDASSLGAESQLTIAPTTCENVDTIITTGAAAPTYINITDIINMSDWGGTYPLHIACMMRNLECAKVLIRNGADPNVRDALGRTALYYYKQNEDKIEKKRGTENDNLFQLKHLIKVTDKNYVDSDDETVKTYRSAYKDLLDAAFRGDLALIRTALEEDITFLEYADTKGHTPLMYACMGKQVAAAKLLMDYGAQFYRRNGNNRITIDFMKNLTFAKELRTYNYWRGKHRDLVVNHGPMRVSYLIKVEEDERYQKRLEVMKQYRKEQRRIAQYELIQFGFYVLQRQNYAVAVANDIIDTAKINVRDYMVDMMIDEEYQNFSMKIEDEFSEMAAEYLRNYEAIEAAKLKARLEYEEMMRRKAAAELAARLEAERIARLKLEAETAERVRRLQHAKRRKEAELQAINEWNDEEERLRLEAWTKFCSDRPHRVHLYRRMRLSFKNIAGEAFSPRTEDINPLVNTYS